MTMVILLFFRLGVHIADRAKQILLHNQQIISNAKWNDWIRNQAVNLVLVLVFAFVFNAEPNPLLVTADGLWATSWFWTSLTRRNWGKYSGRFWTNCPYNVMCNAYCMVFGAFQLSNSNMTTAASHDQWHLSYFWPPPLKLWPPRIFLLMICNVSLFV